WIDQLQHSPWKPNLDYSGRWIRKPISECALRLAGIKQPIPIVADRGIDRPIASDAPPIGNDYDRIPLTLVVGDRPERRIVDVLDRRRLAPGNHHALIRVVRMIDEHLTIGWPTQVEHELQSDR